MTRTSPVGSAPIALFSAGMLLAAMASVAEAQIPSVGPVVNTNSITNDAFVTTSPQFEPAISINQMNPMNLVAYSNVTGNGIYKAFSNDAGKTWESGIFADGTDATLPTANTDPSAASDSFGDQFVTFMDANANINLLESTDGGKTYAVVATPASFKGPGNDQPTVVTGPGPTKASRSVWLSWHNSAGQVVASGAMVSGAGAAKVGNFTTPVAMLDPTGKVFTSPVNFGDVTVGPGGQVAVTYQDKVGGNDSTANLYVNTSSSVDFIKQTASFGSATLVTSNALGGAYGLLANGVTDSKDDKRGVDAEAGLAWDHSGGKFNNRLYLIYTIGDPANHNDTDIVRRVSVDGGQTWSNQIRVQDFNTNSQFMPRIAVDQTTGNIAASWYDARNDNGDKMGADTDGTANNETQFFATISTDGGNSFLGPDLLVSDRSGKGNPSSNAATFNDGTNKYGDYSALDFYNGIFYPAWIDNSNSTQDNFFGTGMEPNLYTVAVSVPEPASALLMMVAGASLLVRRRARRFALAGDGVICRA